MKKVIRNPANVNYVDIGDLIIDCQGRGYYVIERIPNNRLERLQIESPIKDMLIREKKPLFLTKLAYNCFPYDHVSDMRRLKKRKFSYICGHAILCELKLVSGLIKFGVNTYTLEEYIKFYCYLNARFEDTRRAIEKEMWIIYQEMESRSDIKRIRERA
jgi:hypothetical protein